jgi:tetratricopeptide (TPR) repeat protein
LETDVTDYEDAAVMSPDPSTRAWALMERGISLVDSGEHDAGMADLLEAERIAEQADLDELISACRINQGHAYSAHGDLESATRLFGQAADLSRAAGNKTRLRLSLANLAFVLKEQGRHAEAVTALTEELEILSDHDAPARGRAYLERAISFAALGEDEQSAADLAEADAAAAETDDQSLRYLVRMHRANAYLRVDDLEAARIVLEQAFDFARASGDSSELQQARLSLAHVCRRTGMLLQADSLFSDVEKEYRAHDDTTALADALYWHGLVLRTMGRTQPALAKWREEEAIQRENGQDGPLAECLYAQAEALRAEGDHDVAEPLYRESLGLFEELGMRDALPVAMYGQGMSLRALGNASDALRCADGALREARATGDPVVERRTQNLRAMALADLGEIAAAYEALDAAEKLCEEAEAWSAKVWTLARRAYVAACDGREPQEVIEYLRTAHMYAIGCMAFGASRSAARKIAAEIGSHCGDSYAESLAAFLREQSVDLKDALEGGGPQRGTPPVSPEVPMAEAPDAPSREDDDLGTFSVEE